VFYNYTLEYGVEKSR